VSTLNRASLRSMLASLDRGLKVTAAAAIVNSIIGAALCLAPVASRADQMGPIGRPEDYLAVYVSLLDASGNAVGEDLRLSGTTLAPVVGFSYVNSGLKPFTVASARVRIYVTTALGEIAIPCPDDSLVGASMSCGLPAFAPAVLQPGDTLNAVYDRTKAAYVQIPNVSFGLSPDGSVVLAASVTAPAGTKQVPYIADGAHNIWTLGAAGTGDSDGPVVMKNGAVVPNNTAGLLEYKGGKMYQRGNNAGQWWVLDPATNTWARANAPQ